MGSSTSTRTSTSKKSADIIPHQCKKILLLGPRGFGKDTFLKQLKLLYGNGFDDEYRIKLIPHIYKQTIKGIQYLTKQCNINLFSEDGKMAAEYLLNFNKDIPEEGNKALPIESIQILLKEQMIIFMHKFGVLNENTYFLSHIDRIAQQDYIPNDEDIINASVDDPDLKLKELEFDIKIRRMMLTINITNPCVENSNWDECKNIYLNNRDRFSFVIFIASSSCYDDGYINDMNLSLLLYGYIGIYYDRDEVPDELILLIKQFYDKQVVFNAMSEQLQMYRDIALDESKNVTLFLNKTDILKSKLRVPIKNVFPGFEEFDEDPK